MRKNITITADTLNDLKRLNALLGLNHSKLIAVALKALCEKVHTESNKQLKSIYCNITKDLTSKLK